MNDRFISHIHFGVVIIILHSVEFRKLQTLNFNYTTLCYQYCVWIKALQMANCSDSTVYIKRVPGDCGKETKRLDLSEISIGDEEEFDGRTFENYTNLQQLYMKKIKRYCQYKMCPMSFKADIFTPLKSLEVLDLSDISSLILNKSMKWPPKLKVLHLTGLKLDEVPSMAYLEHFTEFNAARNGFHKFPEFNTLVPVIYYIELNDNPLDDLSVLEIAPLCSLKYLGIRVTSDGKFSRPSKYCSCIRLRKWMKDQEISGVEYLRCNNSGGELNEKSCTGIIDMTFAAELEIYNKCSKSDAGTSLWELLMFIVFFSILFPALYFSFEVYNHYFGKSKEPDFQRASKLGDRSVRKSHRSSMVDHEHEQEDEHDDHDHDDEHYDYEHDHSDDQYEDDHNYQDDGNNDRRESEDKDSHVNTDASFTLVLVHVEKV